MSFDEVVSRYFPGLISEEQWVLRCQAAAEPLGFTGHNTTPCISMCREHVCSSMAVRTRAAWGDPLQLGGLAGMFFAGKTGLATLLESAAPVSGRPRYAFFCLPHLAVGEMGEIGQYPSGRAGVLACAALGRVQREFAAGNYVNDLVFEDAEFSWLKSRLGPHVSWGQAPSLLQLTRVAHELIVQDVERALDVVFEPASGDYVLFSGVQVHGPGGKDWVWPCESYVVAEGERRALSL